MFDTTALKPLVNRVAHSVSSSFPSHYQIEDTEQEIFLWVLENQNTVERVVRDNPESWEGILYPLMSKAANKHLKKEDAATYGYSADDVFEYSTSAVEALLETAFSYEDWQSFGIHGDGQPRAKGQVNETGDMLAMLVDVKSAVERLTEKQYNAIVWRYKYHWTPAELAEGEGITRQGAEKRLGSAVQAIRKSLGVKPYTDVRRPGEARRSVIGNTEANAITDRQYEG